MYTKRIKYFLIHLQVLHPKTLFETIENLLQAGQSVTDISTFSYASIPKRKRMFPFLSFLQGPYRLG